MTMVMTEKQTADVARIRELMGEWAEALRKKDVDALMRFYTPDVVVFDVVAPVSYKGTEQHRQNWQQWFDSVPGPIRFEMDIIDIVADGDVAFAFCVNRVGAGDEVNEVRATVCHRRVNGEWLAVHEHASVPLVIPKTGR
jgi:ketosteroid isomerase-like protein